jgi:hypothetical protein
MHIRFPLGVAGRSNESDAGVRAGDPRRDDISATVAASRALSTANSATFFIKVSTFASRARMRTP